MMLISVTACWQERSQGVQTTPLGVQEKGEPDGEQGEVQPHADRADFLYEDNAVRLWESV